jgi:GNAT superfamily N-acetyltransferase
MSRVRDDAGLRDWHAVSAASLAADFVALPVDPIDEFRPILNGRVGDEDIALHLGVVAGTPVVAGLARLPVYDNLNLANVDLRVHPDHRRRGHGRAALAAMLEGLAATGRRTVLFEIPRAADHHGRTAGEAFAESLGAVRKTSEARRLLDLAGPLEERYAEQWAKAKAAATGYSTVAWGRHTPAELVPQMADLRVLMSTDPPQGDLQLETERWDADRYRAHEQSLIDRRREQLIVAARHDDSGALVGFTSMGLPCGGATVGYQWDTVVRSEHRGHRLGLLLKIANLRQLRALHPEVRYLNTWNADENSYMVAVNVALGFEVMEHWSEWQLDLEPD